MKKTCSAISLAALAVLGASATGSACAQSVTLGGRIDVGPQIIDNGDTTRKNIDSGAYTSSRFFFKGNEDLGGGTSAIFYMESRFNADTGAQQSTAKFWNAGAYVGLSDKTWGTLTLGRQYVPTFWSFLFADDTGPLRLHGYSAVQSIQRSNFARLSAAASPITATGSLDSSAGGIYALNITSAFEDNLAVYKTPVLFGGMTAMLAVGAPEGYAAGQGKVFSGNVEYRNGPLYATVAATSKEGRIPAGGAVEQKMQEQMAGGMYAVTEAFKVWGNVHPWKLDSAGTELKGRDWMLGTSYRFSNSMVWVNYASKKIDDCVSCDSRGFGIGYHYFLSKRTELYASFARVGNEVNSANSLNGFAPSAPGQAVRGTAMGVAHQF